MTNRLFQTYLSLYLRTLQEDDDDDIEAEAEDEDDEEYEEEYMEDEDDALQVPTRFLGRSTIHDMQTRRQREEEKERSFQEELAKRLKTLNEHHFAQTIHAHSGRYCMQVDMNEQEKELSPMTDCSSLDERLSEREKKKHYYSGVNYNTDRSLVHLLHKRKIGGCGVGALHRNGGFTQSPGQLVNISSRFLPSYNRGPIGKFNAYLFCGQFSLDGNFFMSACQDQTIRIYDVNTILLKKSAQSQTNPSATSELSDDEDAWMDDDEDMSSSNNQNNVRVKHIREIKARDVGWSIIDCNPSPDNKYLVYSSWSPYIHLASFVPPDYNPNENIESRVKYIEKHEQLNLNPGNIRFCAFSVRFSPNGKEILAGANDDHLYIYDLEKNVRTEKIYAHKQDINSVCYADGSSPNLFYSGSDDGLCKVWDRRQLSNSANSAVGVLVGHSDGITCVSSKGDGRYLISNGKDQTCKLWDIRKMQSASERIPQIPKTSHIWDYRYEAAPSRHARVIHPNDMSLMTYTGHHVLQTLIRCYFSPIHTTGQQYIYSGSQDGIIYIFDVLTGQIVKRLIGHSHIVRDVSWHPHLPMLLSSSWDGNCLMWTHSNFD